MDARVGIALLAILLGTAGALGGYYWWKHSIITEALTAQIEETEHKTKKLLADKQHEVDMINKQNAERTKNAIEIYAKHYDDLRVAADRIPERVFINTKNTSCSNSLPGTTEDRPKTSGGIGGTGKAELQRENIRELNKTILMIEDMQLKCERLLNTVE